MPNYAALIRGINVGGRKLLKMSDLQRTCEGLGLEGVRTWLQSGNVVFRSRKSAASIEKEIERAIAGSAGMDVRVMVRSHDQLLQLINTNPFVEESQREPSRLLVVFFEREPSAAAKNAFREAYGGPEAMEWRGSELFIFYGDGMGKSKLVPALYEKKLGVAGTARNWNTVTKLVEMTG
jgi:uncharacterized protein (DUF1697 family)